MQNGEFIAALNRMREVSHAFEYSWGMAIYHVSDGPSDLILIRSDGQFELWRDKYGDEKGPEIFEGERPDFVASSLHEMLQHISETV